LCLTLGGGDDSLAAKRSAEKYCCEGDNCGFLRNGKQTVNKVFKDAAAALHDVQAGATIMLGGFGLCGIPENCIAGLLKRGVGNLHTISNNMGVDGFGLGLLLEARTS